MITGGVDSMEKYKYMLGQAHAYQIVIQEISNLLKPKEQKDDKETLSTSEKEVPKIKLGLQDKYEEEKKEEPHAKRLDENNIRK